jgi:signal transduction histidine kinase/CheY-like chemotaxis protein
LRPEERSHFDPYRHFEEHAIFALSDAKGSLLLSTPKRKQVKVPDGLFSLIPDALAAKDKPTRRLMPSKLEMSAKEGTFTELAPLGEKRPWILCSIPLRAELPGGEKVLLLKVFPYPDALLSKEVPKLAKIELDRLILMVSMLALFGLLLFFPSLFFIARGISRSMAAALSFSNSLAKGDFPPSPLKMSGSTEINELCRSLNHMRDRLSNTISKLKKSHEREMQARKDAEAANHLKSDFLANMSLELRNPLNSIMGFSTLMMKDIEKGLYDESLKSKVKAIYESAESLNALVSTLLDLSKLDTANVELHPSEFEIAPLLREVVEANLSAANERGITLETQFSPNAPTKAYTDRELLSHTLGLVVSSLIRSNPCGKSISIACACVDSRAFFMVKDKKEPRANESLAEVFLRYSASRTELLPTFAGTMLLNLTIAKNQAHLLGADFEVESSTKDACSVFTVNFLRNELIPASGSETASVHMATNWRSSAPLAGTQTDSFPAIRRAPRDHDKPVRILMAEDNEANRMLVEMMLKDTVYDLESTCDGESCLKALAVKKFDMLLLDLHMPKLDGYSVLDRIRKDRSLDYLPVIVLTAYLEEGDKERLIQMGASKCILKPLNIDELMNTIRAFSS